MKAGKRPHPDKRAEIDVTEVSETKDDTSASVTELSPETEPTDEEIMQDVMQDNLELMLDIIMKIREDPQFAKSIYQDCPRLQHMLDQNPQLRPIFEDPKLVRINFEKAYRDAGGYLPEDKKPLLAQLVNHPAFKFLKFIVFLKKVMGLLQGGGFSFIKNMFQDMFHPSVSTDALENAAGGDGADAGGGDGDGGDAEDGNAENRESKDALNEAADKFEEPEMREKLEQIKAIDDPEELAQEIENDPELKALRDSNELCSELMSDPDTMKIMCEPDNLRALGECPDLIELDLDSPDWNPDADTGGMDADTGGVDTSAPETYDSGMAAADGVDVDVEEFDEAEEVEEEDDMEEDFEGDGDLEDPSEMDDAGDIEEGDDAEVEEEEEGAVEYEMGEGDTDDKKSSAQGAKGKGGQAKKANSTKSRAAQRKEQGGNFFTNVGVGLSEMVAGELVGVSAAELTGGGDGLEALDGIDDIDYGGGMMDDLDDDLEGLEEAVDDAAEAVEESDLVDQAAETAQLLADDDVCDNIDTMNDQLEGAEEAADEAVEKREAKSAPPAPGAPGGGATANEGEKTKGRSIESGEATEEEKPQKRNLKFFGNFVKNVAVAAKEHVATSILGDDFGEALVEKMEEGDEEDDEKKPSGKDGKKGKTPVNPEDNV
eukprot:CAMPEP_0172456688 /NCGR_PEP_ID=MMETSP1065-20121228/17259_1 /TAXON_ID=265537 /ORGANISM="Amphiprora paludosa, Strain CCMP125" /LENGTH=656 /DNA_ID=CAMNT_0013209885 /DNA_START=54 /DNA_END=2024 /DNA_ORIENTATION=-